jgi:hypothetical protein
MFQIEHIIKLCNFFIAFHRLEKRHEAKYRKNAQERNLTGGGSSSAIPLEERGISVWGRVTVTGTPSVCISGEFQAEAHNELLSGGEEENEDLGQVEDDEVMQQPSDRPTPQKPKGRIFKKSAKGIGEEFLELYKKNIDTNEKKKKTNYIFTNN